LGLRTICFFFRNVKHRKKKERKLSGSCCRGDAGGGAKVFAGIRFRCTGFTHLLRIRKVVLCTIFRFRRKSLSFTFILLTSFELLS